MKIKDLEKPSLLKKAYHAIKAGQVDGLTIRSSIKMKKTNSFY